MLVSIFHLLKFCVNHITQCRTINAVINTFTLHIAHKLDQNLLLFEIVLNIQHHWCSVLNNRHRSNLCPFYIYVCPLFFWFFNFNFSFTWFIFVIALILELFVAAVHTPGVLLRPLEGPVDFMTGIYVLEVAAHDHDTRFCKIWCLPICL